MCSVDDMCVRVIVVVVCRLVVGAVCVSLWCLLFVVR